MNGHTDISVALKRIDLLERELATLKRDILHGSTARKTAKKEKPSLFGSVRAGDISGEMIDESKRKLFRDIKKI
jgi:hypothetical protein